MTDYSTLEAGLELDKVIAERLGWSGFYEDRFWFEDPWNGAYSKVVLLGTDALGLVDLVVKEYSTDANAALELMQQFDMTVDFPMLRVDQNGWVVFQEIETKDFYLSHICVTASTPALAICRAWLAWKDAQS